MAAVVSARLGAVSISRPKKIKSSCQNRGHHLKVCAYKGEPIELAGGALWWLNARNEPEELVYGADFVIHRFRPGGPGLVPSSSAIPQRYHRPASGSSQMIRKPYRPGHMILSGAVVIDTEYEVLTDDNDDAATIKPNTECLGMVLVTNERSDTTDEDEDDLIKMNRRHPRRTQRVRFTCNLCGCTNQKEVNPRAWKFGSVFARCDDCTAVHKLVDHLKIFTEYQSDGVFPPRDLRQQFLQQEILDKLIAKEGGSFTPIINPSPLDN